MATYRNSRLLPTILSVALIIIAIVGLVALARFLFFSGSSSSAPTTNNFQAALLDTGDGSSVTMAVRGPIVADENFRSYQITVSPSTRMLKTYTGYLDALLDQDKLTNNVAAYSQFVNALNKANLAAGSNTGTTQEDLLGVCATGRVYEFAVYKDTTLQGMLWTSTCSGSQGTLKANVSQLSSLFQAQIPDSREMISEIGL